jgi:SAM-dependent methyltransferase
MDQWRSPEMVAGFAQSPANPALVEFAEAERSRRSSLRVLDIGCGAGRNALPLIRAGCDVFGTDMSWPMLEAANQRARGEGLSRRLQLAQAPMDRLPVLDSGFDFLIAHGIWNLARSSREFRSGVCEAARAAKPGAALFLFTFSRDTLASTASPVPGETFVFTQFSGEPQCFLTAEQIVDELGSAGFVPDPAVPLHCLNPRQGLLRSSGPVIFEGTFRFTPRH